jgi:hypothetical protein
MTRIDRLAVAEPLLGVGRDVPVESPDVDSGSEGLAGWWLRVQARRLGLRRPDPEFEDPRRAGRRGRLIV